MHMAKKSRDIGGKPNNFVFQAGILAAAGIIVHIIGILYRSPLVAIIGDEGNGYYNTAYNIYMIILFLSSYSIPIAMSKVIAARLSLGQYRNARRLFIGSIIYVIVLGSIGSFICYNFADRLVGSNSAEVLKVFAPTIFLSGLLGTFRGFFQAHHTMVYTSVSQIIEQIINAAVSIGAAYIFVRALRGGSDTAVAIGGARGSALGTGAGILAALIFMLFMYFSKRTAVMKRVTDDGMSDDKLLSPLQVTLSIFGMVTPVILSTCIYNSVNPVNLKIYQHIVMEYKGYTEAMAATNFGLYSGKSMQIINIPIAIATAMSSAIIPSVAHSHERGEFDEEKNKIAFAIRVTMLIAIPSAFGLLAVAEPVTMLLYPQRASYKIVSYLIMVLSITVILSCLSTLCNAILQGTGNVHVPVINAGVSLLAQALLLVVLLKNTELDLYALCAVMIVNTFMICALNMFALKRILGYRQEVFKTFILPILAAVCMYIMAAGSNYLISGYFRNKAGDPDMVISGIPNLIRLIVSVVFAVITYVVMTIRLGIIGEDELKVIPKGRTLTEFLRKIHLLR